MIEQDFNSLSQGVTNEDDLYMLAECMDLCAQYLKGDKGALNKKYPKGSSLAKFRCQNLIQAIYSVVPRSFDKEKEKALEALEVIKKNIPFWRRKRLMYEFLRVELAIKIKKIWYEED